MQRRSSRTRGALANESICIPAEKETEAGGNKPLPGDGAVVLQPLGCCRLGNRALGCLMCPQITFAADFSLFCLHRGY